MPRGLAVIWSAPVPPTTVDTTANIEKAQRPPEYGDTPPPVITGTPTWEHAAAGPAGGLPLGPPSRDAPVQPPPLVIEVGPDPPPGPPPAYQGLPGWQAEKDLDPPGVPIKDLCAFRKAWEQYQSSAEKVGAQRGQARRRFDGDSWASDNKLAEPYLNLLPKDTILRWPGRDQDGWSWGHRERDGNEGWFPSEYFEAAPEAIEIYRDVPPPAAAYNSMGVALPYLEVPGWGAVPRPAA